MVDGPCLQRNGHFQKREVTKMETNMILIDVSDVRRREADGNGDEGSRVCDV